MRCPNHFFVVKESSALPWWYCDLFWCHQVVCGVKWNNVLGCETTWKKLLWFDADVACHPKICKIWLCRIFLCIWNITPILLHSTTQYYASTILNTKFCSSTTLSYKVICQYLFCTTKYFAKVAPCYKKQYSSTTLDKKELLQYYCVFESTVLQITTTNPVLKHSAPHRTNPIIFCSTKYYSSPTLYYPITSLTTNYCSSATPYYKVFLRSSTAKVLLCSLKCFFLLKSTTAVPQSTAPIVLGATKHYSVPQSTTLYHKVELLGWGLCKHCSVLQSTNPALLCSTKDFSSSTPCYKILLECFLETTKNHSGTTPNTVPATQNECHAWSITLFLPRKMNVMITNEPFFAMRGGTGINLQPQPNCILKSYRKFPKKRPIWPWRRKSELLFRPGTDSVECHSSFHSKFHQMLHLPQKETHEHPQDLTHELPRRLPSGRFFQPNLLPTLHKTIQIPPMSETPFFARSFRVQNHGFLNGRQTQKQWRRFSENHHLVCL